jgi:serine/threonine-protein kinase
LAAASGPLFVYIHTLGGGAPADSRYLAQFFIPLAISAVVSIFPAFVVGRLHRNLERARQLGSYRLEGLLGKGGMGEVWRARHQMLIRPAAIKLINPHVFSGAESGATPARETIVRFEREVQATASLKSPHTVSVFDFGVTDNGSLYYVMELLDGLNGQSLVSTHGPVGDGRAIYLLKQVCHSLAEAHTRGLIHRDIKPANIFVCRQGLDYDFVKVLDFGLVKPTDQRRDSTQLTAEGILAGTPAFIAPEVALGKRDVDHRLDIYALGCVAYWLVTGATVFEGDTPMSVVLKHVQEEPIPPHQRTELAVAPEFEQIILGCLAKDPSRRPRSVLDLLGRLESCAPVVPWDTALAQQWWETHRPTETEPSSLGERSSR